MPRNRGHLPHPPLTVPRNRGHLPHPPRTVHGARIVSTVRAVMRLTKPWSRAESPAVRAWSTVPEPGVRSRRGGSRGFAAGPRRSSRPGDRGHLPHPPRRVPGDRGHLPHPPRTVPRNRGHLPHPARRVPTDRGHVPHPARTVHGVRTVSTVRAVMRLAKPGRGSRRSGIRRRGVPGCARWRPRCAGAVPAGPPDRTR